MNIKRARHSISIMIGNSRRFFFLLISNIFVVISSTPTSTTETNKYFGEQTEDDNKPFVGDDQLSISDEGNSIGTEETSGFFGENHVTYGFRNPDFPTANPPIIPIIQINQYGSASTGQNPIGQQQLPGFNQRLPEANRYSNINLPPIFG